MSNSPLQLQKASPNQSGLIGTLARKIWIDHYAPMIGTEQVNYMLAKFYSDESLRQQMEDRQVFYFIEKDLETVGFISVSEIETSDWFIHKFYILPHKQGSGIGKEAFKNLLDITAPARTIRLTVNRRNYKTINFYFKNGFTIEEVKDSDIGSGYFMNDFVMLFKKQPHYPLTRATA